MGPRRCSGYTDSAGIAHACQFHPTKKGGKAQGKEDGRCVVCSPTNMARACSNGQLRGCLMHHLRRLKELDVPILTDAVARIPIEWRMVIIRGVYGEGAMLPEGFNMEEEAAESGEDSPEDEENDVSEHVEEDVDGNEPEENEPPNVANGDEVQEILQGEEEAGQRSDEVRGAAKFFEDMASASNDDGMDSEIDSPGSLRDFLADEEDMGDGPEFYANLDNQDP
jgi:hypothetical protein